MTFRSGTMLEEQIELTTHALSALFENIGRDPAMAGMRSCIEGREGGFCDPHPKNFSGEAKGLLNFLQLDKGNGLIPFRQVIYPNSAEMIGNVDNSFWRSV